MTEYSARTTHTVEAAIPEGIETDWGGHNNNVLYFTIPSEKIYAALDLVNALRDEILRLAGTRPTINPSPLFAIRANGTELFEGVAPE